MDAAEKQKVLTRLRRVAGQVEGLARMIEEGRDCLDVLHQVAAARAALGKVAGVVLESHVHTCVADALHGDDAARREQTVDDLLEVLGRYGGFGRGGT